MTRNLTIKEYQEETDTSTAAFDAIRKMTESLTKLNTAIKNGDHITYEWRAEDEVESELYKALKTYELTLRAAESKA